MEQVYITLNYYELDKCISKNEIISVVRKINGEQLKADAFKGICPC
ncbi:hypothetical protein [Cytobacillus firmus]|nr:hypothetical protein [Cytobacillus firmus]